MTVVEADGVPLERVAVPLGGVDLHLWRAVQLERFVDVDALLRADAPPEPPYWMHLWPGALALARRVAAADLDRRTRVLELGCGLALPALVAAQRGATVVASDRRRAPLAVARCSAADNGAALMAVQMDWRAPALRGGFDLCLCLGADIGYDRAAAPRLAAALAELVAPDGVVWLADSVNTLHTDLADHLRTAGFALHMEQVREEEDGRPVWVRIIEGRRL
jgi:predicted nicotinamide N-methyase